MKQAGREFSARAKMRNVTMLRKLCPARHAGGDWSGGRLQANAKMGLVATFQMGSQTKVLSRTVLVTLCICRDAAIRRAGGQWGFGQGSLSPRSSHSQRILADDHAPDGPRLQRRETLANEDGQLEASASPR